MANDQMIRDAHGKVKRNIHILLGLVFATIIGAVFFFEESKDQEKKQAQVKAASKSQTDTSIAPDINGLDKVISKQKDAVKVAEPTKMGPTVPSVPEAATGPASSPEDEQLRVEEAKQRAQNIASPIMALGGDTDSRFNRQNEQDDGFNFPTPDQVKARAGSDTNNSLNLQMPQEEGPKKPLTKAESDQKWLDELELQPRPQTVKEDPKNSPYTIFQGSLIPAVMLSKVSSQLPGSITAVTTRDVYDGVTGTHLIIPRGSKLFGTYNSEVADGQNRLLVAFTRLIMPGGRSVTLPAMPSVDHAGMSGMVGQVDNRYMQRFGIGLLAAVIGHVTDRVSNNNTGTQVNTGAGSGGPVTAAGSILTDMARQNQTRVNGIPPEITVNQGDQFNIIVNADLAINPQGF